MTPSQVRLRALVACGWPEKQAKRYVKKHPKPQTFVEHLALLHHAGRELFLTVERSVNAAYLDNRRFVKKVFRR